MHFSTKSYLKSTRNHTAKHTLGLRPDKARDSWAWSSKAWNFPGGSNAMLGRAETPLSQDHRDGGATGGPLL
jgi:hypothetical protein